MEKVQRDKSFQVSNWKEKQSKIVFELLTPNKSSRKSKSR